MSCDEYATCPKCKKFEGLKLWLGDTGFSEDLKTYTIEITGGICTECGYNIVLDKRTVKTNIKEIKNE